MKFNLCQKVNALLSKELAHIKEQLKNVKVDDSDPQLVVSLVKDIKKELSKLDDQIKGRENKIEFELARKIKIDPFNREDLFELYSTISKEELIRVLNKLIRKGKLFTVGRDLYTFQSNRKEPIIHLSNDIEKIKRILDENGMIYTITGFDILKEYVNLIPKRMIHLIYVAKGSGEHAKEVIGKKANRICILNPSKTDIRNMFDHYNEDIVLLREVGESSMEYHNQGVASLEKAIIDLYFETTRKRIPFSNSELTNILKNIFTGTKIEYTRLLRIAGRRNVLAEIVRILGELGIKIPNRELEDVANENADKIIRMLR